MSTHFLYRPLDFNWKPEMQRALATSDTTSSGTPTSAALTFDNYVESLMMKLPAFARQSAPTLVVECGYITSEKRLNLADEAFLGMVDTRTIFVPEPNMITGSSVSGSSRSASGAIAGGAATPPPVKAGFGADVSTIGRLQLPHSPPAVAAAAAASGCTGSGTNRNNTALLQALEHRRRLQGDQETYFGMIAFQNLSRPPTDLVAPFRMGAATPASLAALQAELSAPGSTSTTAPIPAEHFSLTLARVRSDEDLLRLYDEIASSSAFREAASRLSIVCFITASPPQGARMSRAVPSSDAPIAATVGQLLAARSGNGGVDIAVLLQQEHHRDAMQCLGVTIESRFRAAEKSAVPPGVVAEHRRWVQEKREQLEQYDRTVMMSSASGSSAAMANSSEHDRNGLLLTSAASYRSRSQQQRQENPNTGGMLAHVTRMPSAADILVAVSTGVGLRGDTVIISRLTSHSASADVFGLWNNILADVGKTAADRARARDTALPSPSSRKSETLSQQQQQLDSPFYGKSFLLPGQGASEWIIPTHNAARDEMLRQKEADAQQRASAGAAEREKHPQLHAQRGASVTAFVQASAGIPPTMKDAVSNEVQTLEQQVQLQKQALRWFQAQPSAAESSPAMQLVPNINRQQQQQQQQNPFLRPQQAPPQRRYNTDNNNMGNTVIRDNDDSINVAAAVNQQHDEFPQAASATQQQRTASSPEPRAQLLHSQRVPDVVESPLQSSPQAVRTKYARAQQETEDLADAKAKWLLELDRVEVGHSAAVAKRFQTARHLAETLTRVDEMQRDTAELHRGVLAERAHVEERSRALIALRKQLDVSDGATKRAEQTLAEVERQDASRQRSEQEEHEAAAQQRKREIDAWYERAVTFQREAEAQRASALARHTASVAEERRRKELLAAEKSKLLQDTAQTEASLRLNEVSIAELRRKVASSASDLQRARALQHELSVTHQDISLDQAVLNRQRLDAQHLQEQIEDMEKAIAATEEKNRVNIHTSEEVGRFAEVATAHNNYTQVAVLRSDEAASRQLILTDFLQLHSHMVRSFVRQAMQIEDEFIARQLKECGECAKLNEAIQQSKANASSNVQKRKQVATDSIAKERQLEMNLAAFDKEVARAADMRKLLDDKLQVHHERHQRERGQSTARLQSLLGTSDTLLHEFLRQVDGETRRCAAHIVSVPASGAGKENSPPQVTVRDVPETSPAFVAAEYARWCDEISDIASAEQRAHELQERWNHAESASIMSSDNVAESRQLLIHLEQENEIREAALRAIEKEVDTKREHLRRRKAELEAALAKEHQDAEQRNQQVAAQVQAATDASARLKQTVRDERFRANALAAEIETVQTGSAVALLLKELNALRESNTARREVLNAVGRIGRSGSANSRNASAAAAVLNRTGVQNPADLQAGSQFPPATPGERIRFGEVAGSSVRVPSFAGQDARSPELRSVPTQGELQSAVSRAKSLLDRRASLAPIPSPAASPDARAARG